jgi:hypothetical protein
MGPIDPEGTIGKVILAGVLACVASWAGLIVLLVRIITPPGDHVAAGVLLVWAALSTALMATTQVVPLEGSGWPRVFWTVVLAPAVPLIAAGVYAWRWTRPLRQSRADRRRMAARAMHDRRL